MNIHWKHGWLNSRINRSFKIDRKNNIKDIIIENNKWKIYKKKLNKKYSF